MWNSAALKGNAKAVLKNRYWIAFAVCLVFTILLEFVSMLGSGGRSIRMINDVIQENFYYSYSNDVMPLPFVSGFFFSGLWVLSVLFSFFVLNPLMVGKNRFFVLYRLGNNDFNTLFSGFNSKEYLPVVKTMTLTSVYQFLWTLLFIIPGIVKSYSYRMVPYILAQNPNMDSNRAITMSRNMMRGEKMNAFILDLSFIGWFLLGMLCCVIGMWFIEPYYQTTCAELYDVLRSKAIAQGLCFPGEL